MLMFGQMLLDKLIKYTNLSERQGIDQLVVRHVYVLFLASLGGTPKFEIFT